MGLVNYQWFRQVMTSVSTDLLRRLISCIQVRVRVRDFRELLGYPAFIGVWFTVAMTHGKGEKWDNISAIFHSFWRSGTDPTGVQQEPNLHHFLCFWAVPNGGPAYTPAFYLSIYGNSFIAT